MSVVEGAPRVEGAPSTGVVSPCERGGAEEDGGACRERPRKPVVTCSHEGECEAASVGAGHQGPPAVGKRQGRQGRRRRRPGQAGCGTLAQAKPPVCGRRAGGGPGVRQLRAKGPHQPREPGLKAPRASGPVVDPEACGMDAGLETWGSAQTRVPQGRGEDARDAEGDGVGDGPVTSRAGGWSLRRRGLRAPRGIAPEQRPRSGGCCALVPNVRKRGPALLGALMAWLVC